MTRVALLGPQRLAPTVGEEVRRYGLRGPIALVTAGWQEREPEDGELKDALGIPAVNLNLYARWEDVQARDPGYFDAHRAQQDRLRRVQEIYRERLQGYMTVARRMMTVEGPEDVTEPALASALEIVRQLDEHHLAQVGAEHARFEASARPGERAVIAEHRRDVARVLAECDSVAIAGGHVAILLNRLHVFDLPALLRERAVIAWSAGAMAMTDRIVLFHDDPPQGAGHAEVLDRGLGVVPGLVALPHARRRLRLDKRRRVSLMARRFAPDVCVPLDEHGRVGFDGERLEGGPGVMRLTEMGRPVPLGQD
jgi:hypothetical protein